MRQSHLRSIGKSSFHPRSQIGNALVKDSRLGQHRVGRDVYRFGRGEQEVLHCDKNIIVQGTNIKPLRKYDMNADDLFSEAAAQL